MVLPAPGRAWELRRDRPASQSRGACGGQSPTSAWPDAEWASSRCERAAGLGQPCDAECRQACRGSQVAITRCGHTGHVSVVPELWAGLFEAELSRLVGSERADGASAEGAQTFLSSLPPGYVEETAPEDAASDWLQMSRLLSSPDSSDLAGRLVLSPCRLGAPGDFRLRRVGLRRVEISSFLPVLESFGLVAVESVPWHFGLPLRPGASDAYIDDIGLRVGTPLMAPLPDLSTVGPRLVEALGAVMAGLGELNVLNRLVLGAELNWRAVNLLCAYSDYRRVVGGPKASERAEAMSKALVAFPSVAAAAAGLFESLLVPGTIVPANAARAELLAALSEVPDLEHDRALRELVSLIEATTRSSWALRRETISLKFASPSVPFLPAPRPVAEVFVWAPWLEALHLRFGLVARGGIRWSDRQSDLRGEVLGLARAQVKKNSLIVPTGAKGAFVLRKGSATVRDQAKTAYGAFIKGLLDVTDNIVEGKLAHPEGIACRDGDDPYLVVAPDKGTAQFSDLANSICKERGFWLGDAFASGGSHGYDHKALAITARGAWVSVRRHFRALGMDAENEQLTVVGVGDMSGDVFGNGMLRSRSICLVAAFDHRHIFVDPSPDPVRSYEERYRLSKLERSSWQDYNLDAASKGAAVYSRHAKAVELSPEARAVLGVRAGPLSPPELVKAVLGAPVDLVFFGGIGTFVKATDESDAEVDDAGNDEVRVSADQLRARVIVEGANLALTQRARASYSRRGGRVNADFVDNAAGVAMSDREVNLKILLGLALAAGRLGDAGRDEMLASAQESVARAVLAEVGRGVVALDRAASSSAEDLAAYEALIADLGRAGLLDPAVESLPGAEQLARRRQAGAGLSRPELAVLLAYARSEVARAIEGSELASDEALWACALRYFPPPVRDAFSDLVPAHPLFRQLVSSELANEVVERMGGVWAHEAAAETGRAIWEVAGAYWAAREVLGAGTLFDEVDASTWSLSLDAEVALRDEMSSGLGRLARWYLSRRGPLKPGELIARDRPSMIAVDEIAPAPLGPAASVDEGTLSGLGIPADVARRAQRFKWAAAVGELAEVARAAGCEMGPVVDAYGVVDEALSLPALQHALGQGASDRWERWQLHLLADDVARARADAVTKALLAYSEAPSGQACRQWLAMRSGPLARVSFLVNQLGPGPADVSLLALAVRALSETVQA